MEDNNSKTTSFTVASDTSEKSSKARKVLNGIAIALCVLLLPILLFNCVLIVKGMLNPNEVPSIGKNIPLIVVSESMDPTIKAGDLIICQKIDASEIKEGDVISFFDPAGNGTSVVTHRVNKVTVDGETGELSFRTQGDNNNLEDRMSVPAENLIGIWTEKRVGVIGHVVLFTQTPIGLLVCIFVPVALFIGYEVFVRLKKEKATKKDMDALLAELNALKAEKEEKPETASEDTKSEE